MSKVFLMALLAIASCCATAQHVASSYWKPWSEVRVYAPSLDWKFDGVPDPVFNAIPDDEKFKTDEGMLISYYSSFASIDLDGDGKDELIVWSHEFFSGGPAFMIFQKRGSSWRIIGEIQGGFAISKRRANGYSEIETWSRHPETHHRLWKFSEGKYKLARTKIGLPKERELGLPYIPRSNF